MVGLVLKISIAALALIALLAVGQLQAQKVAFKQMKLLRRRSRTVSKLKVSSISNSRRSGRPESKRIKHWFRVWKRLPRSMGSVPMMNSMPSCPKFPVFYRGSTRRAESFVSLLKL